MRLNESLPSAPDPTLRVWKNLLEMDPRIRSVAEAYTATGTDHTILADATAAPVTVTLPLSASYAGKVLHVKKVDASANAVTVACSGSDTIEGSASTSLAAQWDGVSVQGEGVDTWIILAST